MVIAWRTHSSRYCSWIIRSLLIYVICLNYAHNVSLRVDPGSPMIPRAQLPIISSDICVQLYVYYIIPSFLTFCPTACDPHKALQKTTKQSCIKSTLQNLKELFIYLMCLFDNIF